SVSRALFGNAFNGRSPDVLLSLFGVGTYVQSHDPAYNDVLKLKGGAEITYNFLSWMGVSERIDEVRLNNSDSTQAFLVSSSRLLFHTGWMSRDEFAIQYSYFADGRNVNVMTGYPPTVDPTASPDSSVFSLTG